MSLFLLRLALVAALVLWFGQPLQNFSPGMGESDSVRY